MTYFIISLIILGLDQATKFLIVRFVHPYESIQILPFLRIVSVRNPGAAFGMFQGLGPFLIIVSIVAVGIISYMIMKGKDDRLSLSFILGGALGNLVDRIRLGHVVDFIDVYAGKYHWPAFNTADSALTVGIALLFYRTITRKGSHDISAGNTNTGPQRH
ncbi:MAG: signal peptidase II [Nitrospirae bacterium]|nr:signal peptidase II [Nitrospirota bacterium]